MSLKQDNILNKMRVSTKLIAKNSEAVSFAVFYVALVMCPKNHYSLFLVQSLNMFNMQPGSKTFFKRLRL